MTFRLSLFGTAVFALLAVPLLAGNGALRHECGPDQRGVAEVQPPAALSGHSAHAATASHETPTTASPVERGAVLSHGEQCSHCAHPYCATSQHCAAPAAVALSSRGAVLIAPAIATSPCGWAPEHVHSANLAPPIPPPQTIL